MKRVAYLSGPIAGYHELNEPMFRAAERRLTSERNTRKFKYGKVIVPHDVLPWEHMNQDCPPSYVQNGDHTAACYLRTDLIHLLTYADDVWMLPGWEASVGARLEMQVAAACGIGIKFFHRNDLGCAHNGHGWGKCDDAECWNYRKPQADVAAAVRRVGETAPLVTPQSMKMAPATARKIASMACVHPLTQFGDEAFCKVEHCPNYYARNAL